MATMKLTDGEVEKIEPGEADVYVWDSVLPRFGVRVTKAGARIYLVQYRAKAAPGAPSKTRRFTIGKHDGDLWNVTKARAAAKKLLAPVDLGEDPFGDREKARAEEAAAQAARAEEQARRTREAEQRRRDSFEAVTERYVACLTTNRSGAETARLLRYDAVPAWTGRHIAEIRRSDVGDLMDAIKTRSPAVARALYAALRGLFGWCVERDLIGTSPCHHLTAPPRPEARDRVLSGQELQIIWKACDRLGYPFGHAIKLLMLTGQRRNEVGGMTWAEVDLDSATWRLPKERTKNGKAHEIDLNPQAVAILREMTAKRVGDEVFPARKAPKRRAASDEAERAEGGLRGWSAAARRLDRYIADVRREAEPPIKGDMPAWRLHDLRRTAATGMAGLGFPPHVVERVLNHVSGAQSGLVGVYQRHEYRPERKTALEAWGAHVEAAVTGVAPASNVTPMKRPAGR
jgi:integrase